MHWKLKAHIQNGIALLPPAISYASYYWIQRRFGGLRHMDPIPHLVSGVRMWRQIRGQGHDPRGKVFFEVGTGRVPLLSLAYWLMGAKEVITIDLHRYLKSELTLECLGTMVRREAEILDLFGKELVPERWDFVKGIGRSQRFEIDRFCSELNLRYLSPADAADTGLPLRSVDYHTSHNVLEHIPAPSLVAILKEGNRLISDNGLFVHRIDYSDHFSHSDPRISSINFLRYSDRKWNQYARNKYMYMNRLRHDDVVALFRSAGHEIVEEQTEQDEAALIALRSKDFLVDARFAGKPETVLSITASWMVSRKNRA